MPKNVRNRNTKAYSIPQIQAMLNIASEREQVVILLCSSACLRIGAIPDLSIGSLEPVGDLYKIRVYEGEPESYVTYCSNECRKAISNYLSMRQRMGENISKLEHPLVREQFDRRDPFAIAHPKRINRLTLRKKLTEMAEAVGIRTKTALESGQKGAASSQRKEIPITNGFRYHYITTLINTPGIETIHRYLLEGHNLKYNDQFYGKVEDNTLYKSYMLAHNSLLIDQQHKLRERIKTLEISANSIDLLAKKLSDLEATVKGQGKN